MVFDFVTFVLTLVGSSLSEVQSAVAREIYRAHGLDVSAPGFEFQRALYTRKLFSLLRLLRHKEIPSDLSGQEREACHALAQSLAKRGDMDNDLAQALGA